MSSDTKNGIRGIIATLIWLIVFGTGMYQAFLRYICANPLPYPIEGYEVNTCRPPYTTLGSVVIFIGIAIGASALSVLYWKFGRPRNSKNDSTNIPTES